MSSYICIYLKSWQKAVKFWVFFIEVWCFQLFASVVVSLISLVARSKLKSVRRLMFQILRPLNAFYCINCSRPVVILVNKKPQWQKCFHVWWCEKWKRCRRFNGSCTVRVNKLSHKRTSNVKYCFVAKTSNFVTKVWEQKFHGMDGFFNSHYQ